MSIWTINREQLNQQEEFLNPEGNPLTGFIQGGTGLPFYLNQLSQSRYNFANTRNYHGGWKVPSNKFPTWQVVAEDQVYQVFLIEASNDNDTPDGPPQFIPELNNFYKKCYDNESGSFQAIVCDDRDRSIILDCSKSYYFQLGLEDYPDLFSELFTVYNYNLLSANITGVIDLSTPTFSNITLSVLFQIGNTLNVSSASFGGQALTGNPTNLVISNIAYNTPQTVSLIVDTLNAGTFKQDYEITVIESFGVISLRINKIYQ